MVLKEVGNVFSLFRRFQVYGCASIITLEERESAQLPLHSAPADIGIAVAWQ